MGDTGSAGRATGLPTLVATIERFRDARVLVVGDAVLDGWLHGTTTRLCREAPVPVVDVHRTEFAPGAAANTAVNLAALGAQVEYAGIVGADGNGADLRRLLRRYGVADHLLLEDPSRATTGKRRLLCDGQVTARFDEGGGRWDAVVVERFERAMPDLLAAADVVVVCDYDDGALGDGFRQRLARARTSLRGPLVVDAHEVLRWRDCAPTAVTPSLSESMRILGHRLPAHDERIGLLLESSDALLDATGAEMVLTTADAEGAVLHLRGREPHRTYASPGPLNRTCGAGDTFTAAFALALGSGASPQASADLAQLAAGVVVGRDGTSVCSAEDLAWRCADVRPGSTVTLEEARARLRGHRADGRRIVFTNGCFDILHAGHAAYLQQARHLGDVLVVGINSDLSVRHLKGPERPLVPEDERARLVASLGCVDLVVLFDEDSPRGLIEAVQPDLYVKGGDYTAEMLPETDLVRRLGGEVVIVDYVADHSTTGLVDRIRGRRPVEPASRVAR